MGQAPSELALNSAGFNLARTVGPVVGQVLLSLVGVFMLFAVNAAMILFGALQEKYEQPGSGGLLPFIFGSMVGIVPWILVLIYFLRPGSANDVAPPEFVVGIVISLFVFFNTFAINQWLQYKQVGKWKSYLQGERSYITLSLVAKTALAWQVFSGAIIPAIAS